MDRNQEQQEQEKPAQGAPATTYATNVRVPYSKLFNYGLTNDANGDLVIDDPNDKDLYPDQVDRVEEPFVAAPAGPEPTPESERPPNPSPPPQQAESTSGDQLSDWTNPIPAPAQYGQAPESQLVYNWNEIGEVVKRKEDHNPQEYAEDLMWEDEEAPDQAPESQFVYDRVDQEMEDHEQQEDAGNVMLENEESYEDVLGPISTKDLVDFDDCDMFIDWLYQGAQEQDGEVAPEEKENEEKLEKEEDEQEQEKVAETARKLKDLEKVKAVEEEKNQKLIEQLLREDASENRLRTLRNRGRLEKPKKKQLTADEEKAQEELQKKAQSHKMHTFEEGISNDPNAPEIEEILKSMGLTLPRARPEETRRRRYESESDNENYDPEESRRARRKQQAKRRKHNNSKRH
ncbi:unnamed protein product [Caenorhabditis brenneri]